MSQGEEVTSAATGQRNERAATDGSGMRCALHLAAAVHFWFSCYYDWFHVVVPEEVHSIGKTFGRTNKLKFLTYWNALLQAFFFTVCFINDLLGNNSVDLAQKPKPAFRKFQDTLMTCLAFPLSMFVGLTFWGLYLVDRELVLPKAVDAFFPWWLNHCMHTNILIFILLEMMLVERQYPSRRYGLSILSVFMLTYLAWIHVIFHYTGAWVYPVLDVLDLKFRIVFFVGLLSLVTILYVFGEMLNNWRWGDSTAAHVQRRAGRLKSD